MNWSDLIEPSSYGGVWAELGLSDGHLPGQGPCWTAPVLERTGVPAPIIRHVPSQKRQTFSSSCSNIYMMGTLVISASAGTEMEGSVFIYSRAAFQ